MGKGLTKSLDGHYRPCIKNEEEHEETTLISEEREIKIIFVISIYQGFDKTIKQLPLLQFTI